MKMEEKVRNIIISKSIIQTYPECLVEWEFVGEDHRIENRVFECPCRRYKLSNAFFWLNSETKKNMCLGGTCQTHMKNDYEVEQKKPKQKKNDEPPKSKEDYVFSDDEKANLINHFTRRVNLLQKQHKSQRDYYYILKQLKRLVFEIGLMYLQPIYEEVYELNEEMKREQREEREREQRKNKEHKERIERKEKERLEREKEQLERDEKEQLERGKREQLEREKEQLEREKKRLEQQEREKQMLEREKQREAYYKESVAKREKQEKEEEEAFRKLCVVMKEKIYTFKEKYPRDTWVQYFKNNNMNNKKCVELTEILWNETDEVEIFRKEVRGEIIKLPEYIRMGLSKQRGFYGIWEKPTDKEKMDLMNFFGNKEEKPPKKILRN